MLHFIRERAKGWVAWFIVGLISIPFALWGVNSYLNGPSDAVTATVNGEPIKQVEFQRAYQQYRERMRDAMGEQFDPALFEGQAVKQNVLDSLIERKLLQLANAELGQRISDSAIKTLITSTPAFQTEGKFDPERYRMLLARVGESPASYEAQLRIDILARELTDTIQQSVFITSTSIDNILRLEKQTRDIAYGVISAQSLSEQIQVSDSEVQDFYDNNKSKYLAPERLSVNYIELSVDELAKTVDIDEQELKQFYLDNQNQFVGPEQRRASHILIEGDEAEALKVISTIQQRLELGEDFSALAKEFSHDAGSASDGGDLGYFQQNVMDPEFDQAVFSLSAIGDISDSVKTEFGYHLIKLTDIKQPEGKSFEDAHDDVEKMYRYRQAEDLFYEQAEKLADLSYENPDSLDITAESLGLVVKQTEEFTRDGGTGIASDKKITSVAFSEDVLINNLNSAVIELSKTHLVVLHKNKHSLASQLPFDSIAPAIAEQLKFEKASAKAKEQGEAILAQMVSGETSDTLFEAGNWYDTQSYSRASSEISAQILEQAFRLPEPDGNRAEFTGFSASNGNYIVVKVSGVTDGNPAEATGEERDGLEAYLLKTEGSSQVQAFIDSLKADAEIKINVGNMK